MSTRQTEANRKNGAKSNGPKTPEGKQASSRNSLKHGLTSRLIVLDTEDPAEFEQMREGYHSSLKPVGRVEFDLVDEMAGAKWRQRRCCYLEANILQIRMNQHRENKYRESEPEKDQAGHAFISISNGEKSLADISRYENRYRRSYEKALKDLLTLQKLRRQVESASILTAEAENPQNEPNPPGTPAVHQPSIPADSAARCGYQPLTSGPGRQNPVPSPTQSDNF